MWIRRPAVLHAAAGLFAVGFVFLASNEACAQTVELKECAAGISSREGGQQA